MFSKAFQNSLKLTFNGDALACALYDGKGKTECFGVFVCSFIYMLALLAV